MSGDPGQVRMSEEGVAPPDARPAFTLDEGMADIKRRQNPAKVKYRNATFLSVTVPVDRERANTLLPAGVKMAEESTALVFIADYPWTNFNSTYREAALFLNVRHGPFRAAHCPWIVVDDDVALIGGRETLGFPKKIAEIDWAVTDGVVTASVRRRGVELLAMTGTIGERWPACRRSSTSRSATCSAHWGCRCRDWSPSAPWTSRSSSAPRTSGSLSAVVHRPARHDHLRRAAGR